MIRYLSAAIVLILTTTPIWADEVEVKSTGGAYLGKFKFKDIEPADALLDVERDGRRLVSVKAGYIGNQNYREHWQFDNSVLIYDKLSSGDHYQGADFNERDATKLVCGADVEQQCDVLKSEKVSRNLIIVTYLFRQTGAACAALIYVDEENYSEGYGGAYGDYFARSISCMPADGNTDEALALSSHYLSLVKKEGRRIANLARFDLPKPKSLATRKNSPATSSGTASPTREQSTSRRGTAAPSGDGEPRAQFPVAYKWEGVTDLASGMLTTSTKGTDGDLSASLRAGVGNCTGKWDRKGGKPDTVEGSYGVWYMRCDNGLAASGSYEMTGRRQGTGEGKDSNGRAVTFTFGQ